MNIESMLLDLTALLNKAFPGIIAKVIIFGSRVTGGAREDSDLDVLVIIAAADDWRLKRAIIDAFYDFDQKHSVLTDVTVLTEDEMRTIKGRQPYIQEALETGLAA
jgi:predicted nucleotidyltransferase